MSWGDPSYESMQKVATEASSWFTLKERPSHDRMSGGEKFWSLKEGHPEWVSDIISAAHGSGTSKMMPDDHIYEFCHDAFEAIANHENEENAADGVREDVDIYNYDLIQWAGSNLQRTAYIDDVLQDQGASEFFALLQAAQVLEREEVFGSVLAAVKERAEEIGEDEEPEEDEDEDTDDDSTDEGKTE